MTEVVFSYPSQSNGRHQEVVTMMMICATVISNSGLWGNSLKKSTLDLRRSLECRRYQWMGWQSESVMASRRTNSCQSMYCDSSVLTSVSGVPKKGARQPVSAWMLAFCVRVGFRFQRSAACGRINMRKAGASNQWKRANSVNSWMCPEMPAGPKYGELT